MAKPCLFNPNNEYICSLVPGTGFWMYKGNALRVKSKYCVIVPAYNNGKSIGGVIDSILDITEDIIVVDDGSTDGTKEVAGRYAQVKLISCKNNKGKGHALRKAFSYAQTAGYRYAITIDADGQHRANDIRLFEAEMEKEDDALVVGARDMEGKSRSAGSRFANRFSNFWFRFLTGQTLSDTQSGYRMYPLKPLSRLRFYTRRYEFEVEVLVRAAWNGIPVRSIPIKVYYPPKDERVSHFRPFRDFMRITALNTLLVFVALFYVKPFYFIRYLKRETITEFIRKQFVQTRDSVAKTTFSVMLGVFVGIVPIWGYQTVTALALAYLMRLNKFIVFVACNISIPPMIPIILYASYVTGGWILQPEYRTSYGTSDITLEFVKNNLFQYVVGSMVFAVVLALFLGLVTYALLRLTRKRPLLTE